MAKNIEMETMTDFQTSFEGLIDNLTPEIHANLKEAIELGRWQNGERLTQEQVAHCIQVVIAYDERNLAREDRVAYIDRKKLKTKLCPE